MSEKWDEGDRYVVISADTHGIGPLVEDVHKPLGDTGYLAPPAFQYRPFEGGLALKRLAPARS